MELTNEVQPTGAVLLTDKPPVPPSVSPAEPALEGLAATPLEDAAERPEDEETVAFGVLAVALILAPMVAVLGSRLAWDSVGAWVLRAALFVACAVGLSLAFRLEPRAPKAPAGRVPAAPVREIIALPRPAEPQRQILEPALRCRVCHRRLTDQVDQELGVDNSCYVTHGARRVYVDNPAHPRWLTERHDLREREERLQADADRRHQEALAQWRDSYGEVSTGQRRELAQWLRAARAHDDFLASPAGQDRLRCARGWRTAAAGALGLLVLALL